MIASLYCLAKNKTKKHMLTFNTWLTARKMSESVKFFGGQDSDWSEGEFIVYSMLMVRIIKKRTKLPFLL